MEDLFCQYKTLCKSIRVSFKNCGYNLRPRAEAGLWVVPLIPTALLVSTLKQIFAGGQASLSHVYFATTVVSCGVLVTTILYLMRFLPKLGHRIHNAYLGVPAVGTLLFLLITQNGFILSILGGVMSSYGVLAGLPTLLTLAPSCFTIGEAVVVVHCLIIFVYSSAVNLCHVAFSHVPLLAEMDISQETSYDISTVILQVGMLSVLLMLGVLVASPETREPYLFYVVLSLAVLTTVVCLHLLLGGSPFIWIVLNITRDQGTFNIFLWWIICSIAATVSVHRQVRWEQKASTSQRKLFHLLAVVVFGLGILNVPDLIYLASGVCFAIFLVLEAARILQIPPLSDILKNGFILYGDEKDILIALTPLYLLAGMAAPLWLSPLGNIPIEAAHLMPYLSGLLSIGVGDTAASYIGSNFGSTKWPGTNRTVEGTIACFTSQLAVTLLLIFFDYLPGDILSLFRNVVAIGATSMIESRTDQVDNMVLPLVHFILT
ncbi:dolichol kinase isoform X2 [Thrips palmi]|uniref:dolichol kinase n=1 Tax=Thrips palmi TaxID=161013 RepID=A0A6P8Z923_THRPL|nr:dolichol kinase isoform X2 [Thrips palmi]